MLKFFLIIVFLLSFSQHSYSNDLIYVYVKNATEVPLIMPHGERVESGETSVFRQVPVPERWNDIYVTGLIQSHSQISVKPCQVSFRTYKDLNFHQHIMKTVIFVRQKGKNLICSPQAVEFDKGGYIRPGGLRLSLKKAYQKIYRVGEIRPGKPHLLYEYENPVIPFSYVPAKSKKAKGKSPLQGSRIVRKKILITP